MPRVSECPLHHQPGCRNMSSTNRLYTFSIIGLMVCSLLFSQAHALEFELTTQIKCIYEEINKGECSQDSWQDTIESYCARDTSRGMKEAKMSSILHNLLYVVGFSAGVIVVGDYKAFNKEDSEKMEPIDVKVSSSFPPITTSGCHCRSDHTCASMLDLL